MVHIASIVGIIFFWYAQLQQMIAPDIAAFAVFGISVVMSGPFIIGFYFYIVELLRAQWMQRNMMNLRLFGL
jgi:hypothetical protein